MDSGEESNIINIPIWNKIKTSQPNFLPSKTSSKLATAQGSSSTNFEKIQLHLVSNQLMEQNKLLSKTFQTIISYHRQKAQFRWDSN